MGARSLEEWPREGPALLFSSPLLSCPACSGSTALSLSLFMSVDILRSMRDVLDIFWLTARLCILALGGGEVRASGHNVWTWVKCTCSTRQIELKHSRGNIFKKKRAAEETEGICCSQLEKVAHSLMDAKEVKGGGFTKWGFIMFSENLWWISCRMEWVSTPPCLRSVAISQQLRLCLSCSALAGFFWPRFENHVQTFFIIWRTGEISTILTVRLRCCGDLFALRCVCCWSHYI